MVSARLQRVLMALALFTGLAAIAVNGPGNQAAADDNADARRRAADASPAAPDFSFFTIQPSGSFELRGENGGVALYCKNGQVQRKELKFVKKEYIVTREGYQVPGWTYQEKVGGRLWHFEDYTLDPAPYWILWKEDGDWTIAHGNTNGYGCPSKGAQTASHGSGETY